MILNINHFKIQIVTTFFMGDKIWHIGYRIVKFFRSKLFTKLLCFFSLEQKIIINLVTQWTYLQKPFTFDSAYILV